MIGGAVSSEKTATETPERALSQLEAEAVLQTLAGTAVPVAAEPNPAAPAQAATPHPVAARSGDWLQNKQVLSEDKFRSLVEAAPDALVIVDRAGLIVLVNSQTEKLFGYRRDELLGRPVELLVPERFRSRHVDYRNAFFLQPHTRPMGANLELFGRHKNGNNVPVEISLSPLETDEGTLVISTIRDSSERKRAEAHLRKLEARYRTLVEGIPAVTFMAALDEAVNELYVSPQIEALLGFSQKEWLEDPILWHRQLHPEDRPRWHLEFAQTCATGEPFRSVYRFLARDGRVVWVHGEARVVRDEAGRPQFLQGVAFDITGMKQAEEELKALNQTLEQQVAKRTEELNRSNVELDAFAYTASHDLKEPLRTMTSYTGELAKKLAGQLDADCKNDIERIINGGHSMNRLIEDLYFFARVGREERPQMVDGNRLLEEVRENLREAIRETQTELTAEPLPTVPGVKTELLRLFQNLIHNALKFRALDRVPQVHVSAMQQGANWLFSVRDNGIGIEPRVLQHKLFKEIGQQARGHPRSKYPGTGFGLAICKRIVEHHGGRIWVTSELRNGSTFFFTLPGGGPAETTTDSGR